MYFFYIKYCTFAPFSKRTSNTYFYIYINYFQLIFYLDKEFELILIIPVHYRKNFVWNNYIKNTEKWMIEEEILICIDDDNVSARGYYIIKVLQLIIFYLILTFYIPTFSYSYLTLYITVTINYVLAYCATFAFLSCFF